MFEDSVFASGISTGRKSGWSRWTVLVSFGAQGLLAGALIVVPMVHPDALPSLKTRVVATSIMLRKTPEVQPEPEKPRAVVETNQARFEAPAPASSLAARAPGPVPHAPAASGPDEPQLMTFGTRMGSGPSLPGVGDGTGTGTTGPVVAGPGSVARESKPFRVSSGVISGMLLAPIRPVYPPIARMARVEGTVVVTAIIDKSGRIVSLQVQSGPEMLRSAAVDAVKEARYRPFLLNGEVTEVATTISVMFRMGG